MTPKQPGIAPSTKLDAVLGWFTWILLAALWLFALVNYAILPQKIPVHFNALGQADGFGSKSSIFSLPLVATLIALVLAVLKNHLPQVSGRSYGPAGGYRQVAPRLTQRLLGLLQLGVVLLCFSLVFLTYLTAHNKAGGLDLLVLPVSLGLLIGPTLWYVFRVFRKG
ncbi:DUF1648 domain-containing protein [Paraflavisolibacter sp. H34]|uniref:DUF1648 domain-containing protein n=1 Tax=Huijunlia imazamoxiresistens TaxID=3127457 RepID=UPI003018F1EF